MGVAVRLFSMMVKTNAKIQVQWYLYIIRCRDDSLYTGITNDVNVEWLCIEKTGAPNTFAEEARFH